MGIADNLLGDLAKLSLRQGHSGGLIDINSAAQLIRQAESKCRQQIEQETREKCWNFLIKNIDKLHQRYEWWTHGEEFSYYLESSNCDEILNNELK